MSFFRPRIDLRTIPLRTQRSCKSNGCVYERLEDRYVLAASDVKLLEFLEQKSDEIGPQAIIGGTVAARGSYGWVVSLQDGSGHFCGGTLVSQDAIVTAAHCVEGSSSSNLDAVIGREDLNRTDDGQRVNIAQIIVHPNYNPNTNDADIAVLMLDELVAAAPIGYLTDSNASLASAGNTATVVGWGTTREGGNTVSTLREVNVSIVSNDTANRPVSYGGEITPRMLAAGLARGGVDSCQGDSGGPLFVADSNGDPQLAGVVSWGEGCGRVNKYGIYARVTAFDEWLDEIIGIEPFGQIDFNQERYVAGNSIQVVVRDSNVETDAVEVTMRTEAGDRETLLLDQFSPGRFRGEIELRVVDLTVENGTLETLGEGELSVTYLDVDDGLSQRQNITAAALVVGDDYGNSFEQAFSVPPEDINDRIFGEIEVTGDTDWFQFDGVANTGYTISLELDGSLNDSVVTLYDSDGETVLGYDDDSGRGLSSELTYFPTKSDRIFVEAAGFAANIGTYSLVIKTAAEAGDDHPDIVGGATPLPLNEVVDGEIDFAGDTDWFSFDVEAGRIYQVDTIHGSLDDSQLRLVDSNGRTELAFNDDRSFFSTEAQISYRADETKKLAIEVSGYQSSVGSYEVIVVEMEDDHGHLPENATQVGDLSSIPIVETGEISPQDVDWFAVTLEQDAFYGFETSLGDLGDSVLTIYDVDGQRVLAQNDDFRANALASRLIWQAPADGLYFVEVAGFENASGDYDITLERFATLPRDEFGNRADLATELTLNDTVRGSVNYQADEDWFRFDAIAGGDYEFTVSLGTLGDSFLEIIDGDGQTPIVENDDVEYPDRSSRIQWTATSTGSKFVVVSAFDGFVGSYSLMSVAEVPVLLPGDVNQDGAVNVEDIDLLFTGVHDGANDTRFDVNGDGVVDASDSQFLVGDLIGTVMGDIDLNGVVDFPDFLSLARNFGEAGGWADGELTGDGIIDFEDFLVVARNFGSQA